MTKTNIEEVQYTASMDMDVLVRELNERIFQINLNTQQTTIELRALELLTTIASFEVAYKNQTTDVFAVSALDIYITGVRLRSPTNPMTVVPGISLDGVGAFTPILFDPDVPLSELPATATMTDWFTLDALHGGNAAMGPDDTFQVKTTAGSVGNPLSITVKFDVVGLPDDPNARALDIGSLIYRMT